MKCLDVAVDRESNLLKKVYTTRSEISVFTPYVRFNLPENVNQNFYPTCLLRINCVEISVSGLQTQQTEVQPSHTLHPVLDPSYGFSMTFTLYTIHCT